MKILLWYRNDLRIHDHEALFRAAKCTDEVFPIYIFDPRRFQYQALGFAKTGIFKANFLLETVQNLRENLQKIGSNLMVRIGYPEEIIPQLALSLSINEVYTSLEITSEEVAINNSLEEKLEAQQQPLTFFWQSTLYHIDDLPFDINELPDIFTQFRNKVEKNALIRNTFPIPTNLCFPNFIDIGEIPTLENHGSTLFNIEKEVAANYSPLFSGGETQAINRLNDYFWQQDLLKGYKETRNGMLGLAYSSKFSVWLANGSISPRFIYEQIRKYEAERIQNESTYWLIFELLWRDYFRLVATKFGAKIFYKKGVQNRMSIGKEEGKAAQQNFEKWRLGETGIPLIDANMKELLATGFMSNRGRQNVASFLVKDLHVDWRWGAAWFESQLIDYDVCSNWGNWMYVAGVGNDPRENRYFNILKQATNYDAQGEYVKYWLPALANVPAEKVHSVGLLNREEQRRYGVQLGVSYPNPMVDIKKWSLKR